jgi:hypothetical protein
MRTARARASRREENYYQTRRKLDFKRTRRVGERTRTRDREPQKRGFEEQDAFNGAIGIHRRATAGEITTRSSPIAH